MKKIVILLLLIIASQQLNARQITAEQAKSDVISFVRTSSRLKSLNNANVSLAYTESNGSSNFYYVFNTGKTGFVVASADDCTYPILGYSNGTFDANNIPPALKYMLNEYKKEMAYVLEHNTDTPVTISLTTNASERHAIAPLVTTKWNQSEPYNNLCPMYDNQNRCVTGCVATAMAQVMKYHNWPDQGEGSYSYTTKINGKDVNLSLDFSKTRFDWTNMIDDYSMGSTSAQNDAVATLMYNCGIGSNMGYGLESGAYYGFTLLSFANNFKYDKSIRYERRTYYSIEEWSNIIYNELDNKRPVMICGQSTDGGHAFVCDGYDKDDFYHINWGWGGMADGYFKLTALTPNLQGIGGSSGGFNSGQELIYNIKKDEGGETSKFYGVLEDFTTNTTSASLLDDPVEFSFGGISYYSPYKGDVTVTFGVYAENTATKKKVFVGGLNTTFSLTPIYDYMFSDFKVELNKLYKLGNGTYRLTPALYDETQKKYVEGKVPYGAIDHCIMTIDGMNFTFQKPNVETFKFEVVNISTESQFHIGKKFVLNVTLSNSGLDFCDDIYALILNSNGTNLVAQGYSQVFDLPKGKSQTHNLYGSIGDDVKEGDYKLVLARKINNHSFGPISELYDIKISKVEGETVISVNTPVVKNINNVDASNISISTMVQCTSGFFTDNLACALFDKNGSFISYKLSDIIFLYRGDKYVEWNLSIDNPVLNQQYLTAIFNSTLTERLTNPVAFTITSGIDDVQANEQYYVFPNPADDVINVVAPSEIKRVEVFSASGQQVVNLLTAQLNNVTVDVSNLTPGVYVVKTHTTTGTEVQRIIKR